MGKKSRRQREKDPRGTGLRKVLRHALTADTPLSNLSPQELKKLANDVLDSQDPTRAHNDDDDDDEPAPLSGVDHAKGMLVQVLGAIGRQDVLDANLEKQLRLLTDDAALAYAQYVRGQDPRVLWGLGPGLQAWLLEGISNGAKREDDDDSGLDAVQDAAPAASKPTVAEAEAEYNAAMTPGGFTEELAQASAMMSLRAALTIDKNDLENFDAYMEIVEPSISAHDKLLKAMKRWPRYRKYWPRIRRRICWGCGKQYALSEPRIWVCGGCGEARYCNAACQRAHWPKHKGPCLQTYEYGSGF